MGKKAKRKNQILPIGTHVEVAILNDDEHSEDGVIIDTDSYPVYKVKFDDAVRDVHRRDILSHRQVAENKPSTYKFTPGDLVRVKWSDAPDTLAIVADDFGMSALVVDFGQRYGDEVNPERVDLDQVTFVASANLVSLTLNLLARLDK